MYETRMGPGFHDAFGLGSLTRRLDILRRQFLNHRFERRSPLRALPQSALSRVYDHEVTFPPYRLLMQPGTQTVDGLFFLVSLAQALDARSVFEIGTYIGLTAWTLARNLAGAVVHTLDIPAQEVPALPVGKDDLHRASRDHLVYEWLPKNGTIVQHWGDSARFDFSPWHGHIDLVYLDGAHSEPYVRSDTERALEMVSPAGAIVWDDYWRLSPGVVAALHELAHLERWRVPGTRLVVHLREEARLKLVRP
jgi:Methyltransferase domain